MSAYISNCFIRIMGRVFRESAEAIRKEFLF